MRHTILSSRPDLNALLFPSSPDSGTRSFHALRPTRAPFDVSALNATLTRRVARETRQGQGTGKNATKER